jgi:hypothetical protein
MLLFGYELTAFAIPADPANGWERQIGWEVHGGARLLDLITKGNAASFADAKAPAEAALRALTGGSDWAGVSCSRFAFCKPCRKSVARYACDAAAKIARLSSVKTLIRDAM